MSVETAEQTLARMFSSYAPRIKAYARRHCDPSAVDDIVSDTFLVAWRRRNDVPDDPLPWLLVVARNTILSRRRASARSDCLGVDFETVDRLAAPEPGVDGVVVARATMLAALAELTPREREAVLLIAWDGLSVKAAAAVSGCSVRAFTVRLHRARKRLGRSFASSSEDGDSPSDQRLLIPIKSLPKETL